MIKVTEKCINDNLLPRVWEVDAVSPNVEQVCDWIKNESQNIDNIVDTDGALLIRGFHCLKTAEDFEKILSVISEELMDYIGGTSPRKVVRGKIVTATELPPEYSIPLHQEMSYTANPPNKVVFFCQKPATKRGYTTIADMRKLTSSINSSVAQRFEQGGVQLRRTLPADDTVDKKPGIVKPWSEVFGTNDKEEVNKIVTTKGWKTTWLEDGSVQLWQDVLPAYKYYEKTGDKLWFNQAHIHSQACALHWAKKDKRMQQLSCLEKATDEHPEMLDQVFHGDGTPIAADDTLHVFEVMQNHEVTVALQPADILILNNILVSHGRTSYEGDRSLLAALIA